MPRLPANARRSRLSICPRCDDGRDVFGNCSCEPKEPADDFGPEDWDPYWDGLPEDWAACPRLGDGPLAEMWRMIEGDGRIGLPWVVRWSRGGLDALQGAWNAWNTGESMLHVLARLEGLSEVDFFIYYGVDPLDIGRAWSPALRRAADALTAVPWDRRWAHGHDAVRAAVPVVPPLADLLAALETFRRAA